MGNRPIPLAVPGAVPSALPSTITRNPVADISTLPVGRSTLEQVSDSYMARLMANEATTRRELAYIYGRAAKQLRPLWEQAYARLQAAKAAGRDDQYISGLVWAEQRMATLLTQAIEVWQAMGKEVAEALHPAMQDASTLATQSIADHIATEVSTHNPRPGTVNVGFASFPEQELKLMASRLGDGSPIVESLTRQFGVDAVPLIKSTLAGAMANGENPAQLARRMARAMGGHAGKTSVLLRTEMLRVYRDTQQAQMQANERLIAGWTWVSALQETTCPMCWAMHGTTHPVRERMATHPACRCRMVPKLRPWGEINPLLAGADEVPDEPRGQDLFRKLPKDQQRRILGPKLYGGYESGQIDLEDVVSRSYSDKWGAGRRQRSAAELGIGKPLKRKPKPPQPPPTKPVVTPEPPTKPPVVKRPPKPKPTPPPQLAEDTDDQWDADTKALLAKGINSEDDAKAVGKRLRERLAAEASEPHVDHTATIKARKAELTRKTKELYDFVPGETPEQQRARHNQINLDRIALKQEIDDLARTQARTNPYTKERVKGILKRVRPGYGEGDTSKFNFYTGSQTKAKAALKEACASFPAEWVDEWAKNPIYATIRQRGQFSANHYKGYVEVRSASWGVEANFIHELMHYQEAMSPKLLKLEGEFFDRRTAGEQPVSLQRVLPGHGYGAGESSRLDKFADPYMGKSYPRAYEIATMGAQDILWDGKYSLAETDPDYSDFILGVLAGV